MHRNSPVLSKAVLVAVLAAWSVVFIIVGLFTMLVWPHTTQEFNKRLGLMVGLSLLLAGLFVSAVVAGYLFPGADERITVVFLFGPWVIWLGLSIAFIGGWI